MAVKADFCRRSGADRTHRSKRDFFALPSRALAAVETKTCLPRRARRLRHRSRIRARARFLPLRRSPGIVQSIRFDFETATKLFHLF